MSKFAIFGLLAATGAMVSFASAGFPYDTSMTERYHTNSLTITSFNQPGEVPGSGMPVSDTVATVYMNETVITAVDAEDLDDAMTTIGGTPQAAFALKDTDGTLTWMGYANGAWEALSGVTPEDVQTWWVKIDFDYTDRVVNSSGVRKIRYSISADGKSYTVLKLNGTGDGWLDNGASDTKITDVKVYSYAQVTTGAVGAKSGARAAEGTIAKVEDVSMNYEKLTLSVTATDTWGVKDVVVTLKDGDGKTVDTYKKAIAESGATVFDNLAAQVGGTYTYDVKLTGDAYQGAVMEKADPKGTATVKMFSAVDWFGFNGTAFEKVNMNETTGVTVDSDKGRFYSTDDEIAGTIKPTTSSVEGARTVVTSVLYVDGVISASELPTFAAGDEPQFAIAIATDDDGARHWYYFDESWKPSLATLATANGTYTGEATFDYADTKKVSYRIKEGGLDSTSAYVDLLVTGVGLTANKLDCVQVQGSSFGNMNAYCKTTEPPPVKDEDIKAPTDVKDGQITLRGNTEVGLDKLGVGTYGLTDAPDTGKKGHLKWTDVKSGNGKYAKMDGGKLQVIEGLPVNGVASSYDSYVLGLDPETETDRPAAVVESNLSSNGVGIVVNVPNLTNVRTDLGYTVKLRLEESTDGGENWVKSADVEDVDVNKTLTVPLFVDENAGKLYRVNTIIK